MSGSIVGASSGRPGSCRVCGGSVTHALTARDRMSESDEEFVYVDCVDCGCLQIETIPDDLEKHYPRDYYTRETREVGASRHRRATRSVRPRVRRVWTRMRIGLARAPGLRFGKRFGGYAWFARTGVGLDDAILDVGCGGGRLLFRMADAGFTRLTGIDERLAEERAGPGAPVLLRRRLEDHDGRYRLVMAHHSFEHMRDPRGSFEALVRLVEPGGWLLLRVPCADGRARDLYGADWVQLDAPRHLHLHTRESVERMARETDVRLHHAVDDSGPFQVWGSELYRRGGTLALAGRGGRLRFGRVRRLGFRWTARRWRLAGRGDQGCFYLQRARPNETIT